MQALERAVIGGGYAALLAGSDASLLALSRIRHRLEPYVRTRLPPHGLVERSLDKLALISAASRHGLSSPFTIACRGRAEALAAARRIGFPVIIKPVRAVFEVQGAPRRVGAMFAPDERALESAVLAYGGSCLVQRRERGAVLSFAGVLADGRLLANVLARYHRTWRPDAGGASFSETMTTPPWLAERAESLLNEIGWEGLFELELIECPDGRYAAIDLNPRLFGSLALAIGAGVNLPAVWCLHVLGRRVVPSRARPGVFYRCEEADFAHVLWQLRRGKVGAAVRALRVRRRVVHSHFSSRDPAPLLARLLFLASTRRFRGRRGRAA